MSLSSLFSDLAAHMQSAEFHASARHPDHATAFTRRRKLPLPSLVALMLSGMRKSVQAELDTFFGHLQQRLRAGVCAGPVEAVVDRACDTQ